MESQLGHSLLETDDGVKILRAKDELRDALVEPRRAGRAIGLVPTMGHLHEGHLSLLRAARAECDVVVMSLFVNPAQFGPGEDLDRYPRDEEHDLQLADEAGVDLVYAPPVEEVYPDGFATHVEVEGLTEVLCGDPSRRGPGHFRGVTTVVAKLFNTVQPDVAYFGQKDAQQAIVIRRVVRDLSLDVQIRVLPTVRDEDGLALSSRNARLSSEERAIALALPRALATGAKAHVLGGDAVAATRAALNGLHPDYVELLDLDGVTILASAARIGANRLIDNVILEGELT